MNERQVPLVLVSNRGPVTFDAQGDTQRGSGGVVTALTAMGSAFLRPYDSAVGQLVLLLVVGIFAAAFAWLAVLGRQNTAGRILIAPELRSAVGLQRDVMLLGMGSHFEIWDAALLAESETQAIAGGMPDVLSNFSF